MSEQEQRAAAVRVAREWLATPYRHAGRIKGIAADCTFLAKVYEEAGVIGPLAIPYYNPQSHLHRAGGTYAQIVESFARDTENPQPGDIALYFIGRDFSHGAIIVDPGWPHVIHADLQAGFVIEAMGDQGNLAMAKQRRFLTAW